MGTYLQKNSQMETNASKVREVRQTVRKPLCSVIVGSIVQYWTSSDLCYRSLIINAEFARTSKVLKF